jgi:hypothetical protein
MTPSLEKTYLKVSVRHSNVTVTIKLFNFFINLIYCVLLIFLFVCHLAAITHSSGYPHLRKDIHL